MVSDEALMLEFQRGSRDAFEELFERHRDAIFGFFRRRLPSFERAEDLTQETFLVVVHKHLKYEPRAQVRTYLFGIAFRLLASERRKLAREGNTVTPNDENRERDTHLDSALQVRQALGRLDPHQREVLMLREFEQLDYSEIATLLRIPLNTVRSRLFRARTALKQQLEPKSEIDRNPAR
jgi:RNA polymerase sigma-70 factor (ECF subfamily)